MIPNKVQKFLRKEWVVKVQLTHNMFEYHALSRDMVFGEIEKEINNKFTDWCGIDLVPIINVRGISRQVIDKHVANEKSIMRGFIGVCKCGYATDKENDLDDHLSVCVVNKAEL